ncbi:MAG TPA: glycosyltransferase [Gemmatimonadaceae bacterium]|nr:glycosyltransferase [Gemmatimonadaceae bacterium]
MRVESLQPRHDAGGLARTSGRAVAASGLSNTASSVLHLIQPDDIGGAETVVCSLARAQKRDGMRVAVAAIVHSSDVAMSFIGALREESIEAHRVLVKGRAYLRERRTIADICRTIAPDIVHSHGYRPDIVDALHLRQSVPVVTTVHGYTGGGMKNRVYESLQRRAYRRFDGVVAVSAQLGRELGRTVQPEILHVVPNAFHPATLLSRAEARVALGIAADSFVAGWVGRMSKEKGADVLLDAIADARVPPSAHFAFVGDGPELETLRNQAERLEVASRVTWTGRVPNASRFVAAFDAFILSSRTEGTPMVVLEAMAAGIPIIATRVGGVAEVLPPGTAFLVPPESPSELASAIRYAHDDRESALAAGRAAQCRLEAHYGVGEWVASYQEVYRRARERADRRLR